MFFLLIWTFCIKVVFFTNSGTEANELAIMIARLYTGCHDIISIRNAYHGNASGTMGSTAQKNWKFNIVQVPSNFLVCNAIQFLTYPISNNWIGRVECTMLKILIHTEEFLLQKGRNM
jgi:4-aminobutyrate aminotransferase-like enzyme